MHRLILKPGREKSVKRGHPWLFSGAIAKVEGAPQLGDTVEIRSASGETLGVGAFSPHSQIRARLWQTAGVAVDARYFAQRIERAVELRRALLAGTDTDAVRLLHAESDGLPGVIADRYGDTVVAQFSSAGAERWRDAVADALLAISGVSRVWERSDATARQLEGLPERSGLLRGPPLQEPLVVHEHGLEYVVAVEAGHKTGFYLDQRDNRRLLRELAAGKHVLDCFCYTGGFALNALVAGAKSVTAVDSSATALQLAQDNALRNGGREAEWREADVFQLLRRFRDEGRKFDTIVLDPPKLAPTAAHAERAARAYKDVNLLAFKLLQPGGTLMTFSCSGGVSAQLFQSIVAGAAADAGTRVVIERWLHAAADHPVALHFPEGEYLKGLVCRTLS
jgi:23S rRNA (cytosine1962-C5)-methyltransferase